MTSGTKAVGIRANNIRGSKLFLVEGKRVTQESMRGMLGPNDLHISKSQFAHWKTDSLSLTDSLFRVSIAMSPPLQDWKWGLSRREASQGR